MITNTDRSGWFGASDTHILMGNWETETFKKFWLVKLGVIQDNFSNRYTEAGNLLEIPIIRAIERSEGRKIKLGRRPVYRKDILLRANYDGLCDTVVEIKTSKNGFRDVPKSYWMQCQALLLATKRKEAELYMYKMEEIDYICPWYADIDVRRLKKFSIPLDVKWIEEIYFPRMRYLAHCLRERRYPHALEMQRRIGAGHAGF